MTPEQKLQEIYALVKGYDAEVVANDNGFDHDKYEDGAEYAYDDGVSIGDALLSEKIFTIITGGRKTTEKEDCRQRLRASRRLILVNGKALGS